MPLLKLFIAKVVVIILGVWWGLATYEDAAVSSVVYVLFFGLLIYSLLALFYYIKQPKN